MATLQTAIDYSRKIILKVGSDEFSDADAISLWNDAYLDFQRKLCLKREDIFFVEAKSNFVQDDGKYLLPDDCLAIKSVEVAYTDPTSVQDYKKAEEVDTANLPSGTTWEWLKKNQPKTNPLIDIRGNFFEIAPAPDADKTDAIILKYLQVLPRFTAVSDTLGYPLENSYEIVAKKVAALFFKSFMLDYNASNQWEALYRSEIKEYIDNITPQVSSSTKTRLIGWTGWEF